jgi:hypothetical protein
VETGSPSERAREGLVAYYRTILGSIAFLSRASSGGWLKATTQVGGNPRRAAVAN